METIRNLDNFHDCILQKILINWFDGDISIDIESSEFYRIKIHNFFRCSIPQLLTWGKSIYIYEIKGLKTKRDNYLLTDSYAIR